MEKDLLTLSAWKPDVNAKKTHLENSARPQIEDILAPEFCSPCDTVPSSNKNKKGKMVGPDLPPPPTPSPAFTQNPPMPSVLPAETLDCARRQTKTLPRSLEHGRAQRSHLGRCFIETPKMAGLALEDSTRTLKISALGFVDQTQHEDKFKKKKKNQQQTYKTVRINPESVFVNGLYHYELY